MAFIHHQQSVFREVFEKRRRRFAGIAACQVAAVVFDSLAGTGGFHHFDIEDGALFQPLRFQQFAFRMQLRQMFLQFILDARDGLRQRRARRHIVAIGVDGNAFHLGGDFTGQRVKFADRFDLIAEKRNAPGPVFQMARPQINGFATNAEGAAGEEIIIAAILLLHQALHQHIAVNLPAGFQLHHHARIGLDRTDTINAGHRGNDHHIIAFQQRLSCGMAHAVYLFVDLRIFFDIGIGARHIGFRLIVVIIRNEILHRVFREEAFHFTIKLRGKRLVRCQDQGWALHRLNHLGHGEGLAGTCHTQQHLVAVTGLQASDKLRNGARLVAIRFIRRGHGKPPRGRGGGALFRHEQHGAGGDDIHGA